MGLRGGVCVVTGASSGIGRRTALEFAARGARVCGVARRADRLEELVDSMGGEGAGHSLFVADVSDRAQVEAMARHVEASYGRCDVLVNNAGFSRGRAFEGASSLDDLEAVMATNFFGAVECTAFLLPLLERSAPAHIVNVASVAGRLALGGSSSYAASKFALVGWSEAIGFDLDPKGVAVTLIEPGPLPTEGFPQTPLVDHPVLRRALTSDVDVARAIVGVIGTKKRRRVVPRAYHLAVVARLFVPSVYRAAVRQISKRRQPPSEEGPSDA